MFNFRYAKDLANSFYWYAQEVENQYGWSSYFNLKEGTVTATQTNGLPISYKLLPEYLKEVGGYSTYMIGKWHLGFCDEAYTPTRRYILNITDKACRWGAESYNALPIRGGLWVRQTRLTQGFSIANWHLLITRVRCWTNRASVFLKVLQWQINRAFLQAAREIDKFMAQI